MDLMKRGSLLMASWKDELPKENRYYETDRGVLYKGNSEEILKLFKDNSIDGVITDPPYMYLKHRLDRVFNQELVFSELYRLINNGFLVMFGRGTSFYEWNVICGKLGFKFKEEIIWNKKYVSSPFLPISRIHETISILSKGKKNFINRGYSWK